MWSLHNSLQNLTVAYFFVCTVNQFELHFKIRRMMGDKKWTTTIVEKPISNRLQTKKFNTTGIDFGSNGRKHRAVKENPVCKQSTLRLPQAQQTPKTAVLKRGEGRQCTTLHPPQARSTIPACFNSPLWHSGPDGWLAEKRRIWACTHQRAEHTLTLRDGGHLLQGELS